MRLIRTTFDQVTPESAEDGDTSDSGWVDDDGEEIEVDKHDRDEGHSISDVTVAWLWNKGAIEASSSEFHPGIWYSTEYSVNSYQTGEEEQRSFHLSGFAVDEEREIYKGLKALVKF